MVGLFITCHFVCAFCSQLIATRKVHKEAFLKKHGVKLGFMSAFVKAASFALLDQPVVNAGEFVKLVIISCIFQWSL